MTDTKPGLFSEADEMRAVNAYVSAPEALMLAALNAGLPPQARRVLEAALTFGDPTRGEAKYFHDERVLHDACIDYARYITEGIETHGE